MSFICDECNKPQPVHSSPVRVITKTRPKIYPARKDDPGGIGKEIVEEKNLCTKCAKEKK